MGRRTEEDERSTPGGRRAWVAWVLSGVAHALVAAVLVVLSRGRPPDLAAARAPDAISFEITEAPTPVPAPRHEAAEPLPAPRAPALPTRAHPPVAARAPAAADEAAAVPPPSGGGEATASGTALDLSLGALDADARRRLAGPPPEAALRATPWHRPSVDELRVEKERHEDAVANVERGRADPILYDYLRGARARFEEDARRLAESIAIGPRDAMRAWGRGYVQHVAETARAGARAARAGEGPGSGLDAVRRSEGEAPAPDLFAAYGEATEAASEAAEERQVEVCLDMAPDKTPAPMLRRPSGNAALDRLVVESFTRAIAVRPVPPDVRRGLACYEVRISAYRMPPLPMVGCVFDLDGVSCFWPFKKITSVKGRLLSVDYEHGEADSAKRSLLRRAR